MEAVCRQAQRQVNTWPLRPAPPPPNSPIDPPPPQTKTIDPPIPQRVTGRHFLGLHRAITRHHRGRLVEASPMSAYCRAVCATPVGHLSLPLPLARTFHRHLQYEIPLIESGRWCDLTHCSAWCLGEYQTRCVRGARAVHARYGYWGCSVDPFIHSQSGGMLTSQGLAGTIYNSSPRRPSFGEVVQIPHAVRARCMRGARAVRILPLCIPDRLLFFTWRRARCSNRLSNSWSTVAATVMSHPKPKLNSK